MLIKEKCTIITILNIYVPNTRVSSSIKKYMIADKSHIDPNTVLLDNFSYPLPSIVRSSRQKLKGDIGVQ